MTTASRSARPSGSASSSATSPDAARPRGRPRDPALDQRIKRAALELLAEGGFSGLSVDAICLRAGAPRSSFYRRWPGALEVAADAFNEAARIDPLPDTGDLVRDVVIYASRLGAFFADPVFGACVSFLTAEARLRPGVRQRLLKDLAARRSANREMFDRAAARGEALPDIEPDRVLDIINALAMTTDAAGAGLRPADYELVLGRLLIR